jgi:hypothetical protein
MQRNILKAYAFRKHYLVPAALVAGWEAGDTFCLTVLPRPIEPLLLSKYDGQSLAGFTHIALTDTVMGTRALIPIHQEAQHGEELAPADGALRLDSRVEERRQEDRRQGLRIDFLGEEVHEDGELKEAALTILAAMMASPAHADKTIPDMVEESMEAAAALLHKIYGNA